MTKARVEIREVIQAESDLLAPTLCTDQLDVAALLAWNDERLE
ncbi:MAG: hypothetical protein ABSE86_15635 [Bryobacteraceae bacterium]